MLVTGPWSSLKCSRASWTEMNAARLLRICVGAVSQQWTDGEEEGTPGEESEREAGLHGERVCRVEGRLTSMARDGERRETGESGRPWGWLTTTCRPPKFESSGGGEAAGGAQAELPRARGEDSARKARGHARPSFSTTIFDPPSPSLHPSPRQWLLYRLRTSATASSTTRSAPQAQSQGPPRLPCPARLADHAFLFAPRLSSSSHRASRACLVSYAARNQSGA